MSFHLYQINEVYSNADGSVQFIELLGTAGGQNFLSGHTLTVTQGGTTHTFTFDHDLGVNTNGTSVLIATPGFQALTGVAPDYELPAGNFLFTSGTQTINFASADVMSNVTVPTAGGLSLGQNGVATAINTPKNTLGITGTVPFNHGPVSADLLDDAFTGVGQLFSLSVPEDDFSDEEDDPLTYSATLVDNAALPGWLTFDSNTGVLSGTPGGGDTGTIQIKIAASDGTASASDIFALTIVDAFVVNGDGDDDSLIGTADDDLISGFAGTDTLEGGDGNDILDGGAGNDNLDGGSGDDLLVGGTGNDSYVVSDAGDTISESASGGVDTVLASLSYTLGANLENLTLTGADDLDATGNAGANIITGNSGDNELSGGGHGHDTMAGGDGDDTYFVEHEDEVLESLGEGHDTVVAEVKVTLGDNVEDLVLAEDASVARGSGNALDNALTGNPLRNLLFGAGGDDTYYLDSRGDTALEGPGQGHDTVFSSVSFDLAGSPNVEDLVLTGGASTGRGNALDNEITGNELGNRLSGSAGADTLTGGAGDDKLTGGAGADQFHFDTLAGVDRIVDFESGVDQLVFDGAVFTGALDYDAETGRLLHDGQLVAVLEGAGELIPQDFVIL